MGLAARLINHARTRPRPREPALLKAAAEKCCNTRVTGQVTGSTNNTEPDPPGRRATISRGSRSFGAPLTAALKSCSSSSAAAGLKEGV